VQNGGHVAGSAEVSSGGEDLAPRGEARESLS
jgi:hypothetical protein